MSGVGKNDSSTTPPYVVLVAIGVLVLPAAFDVPASPRHRVQRKRPAKHLQLWQDRPLPYLIVKRRHILGVSLHLQLL